ncbi:wsv301 [White spot syndrome virus]|uniref:Wsv301 n=4 Tax=White spot syndrome virus TaxID=342409 RepID=Q8VAT6_WSSVS|nr:wsv301 [Shrimp white spot syndrome virus]AFX59678.1 wsv301 [White spot syndrome virus]AAL33303.1 wsv301 [Shrimp white spot syndrome virus]AAL89225.1 WSSV357 [Shrimp white spot syndrome virus]AWQ60433.1 wsv301 [Shrimp white spot syndrome virus]AWQ60878.1 wsv301 [Shrimp white spot syndrome virus]
MGSEMSRSLSGVLNRTWLMKLDSVLLPFLFFLFLFFSHGEQEMQVVVLSMHFTSMFMASASPIVMEQPTANPLRKVTRIMLSLVIRLSISRDVSSSTTRRDMMLWGPASSFYTVTWLEKTIV